MLEGLACVGWHFAFGKQFLEIKPIHPGQFSPLRGCQTPLPAQQDGDLCQHFFFRHPGEVLRELYLDGLGLSITEAAKGLGVSRKALSELVNGKAGISPLMAMRLSIAFPNTSPQFWLNLQNQYSARSERPINL